MEANYLIHHGILGQSWGKLNGPPYPLGASDHSAAEKKEGKSGWTKEARAEKKSTNKQEKSYKATKNGSFKTDSKAEKIGEIDKKYYNSSNKVYSKKITKAFRDYEKSADKDEKEAIKNGDLESARSIAAGRTFMRTIVDDKYRSNLITIGNYAAKGQKFVETFTRNDALGGVDMVYDDGTSVNFTDSKYSKTLNNK